VILENNVDKKSSYSNLSNVDNFYAYLVYVDKNTSTFKREVFTVNPVRIAVLAKITS